MSENLENTVPEAEEQIEAEEQTTAEEQVETPSKVRRFAPGRLALTTLGIVIAVAVIAVLGTLVWEWSNSTDFCANVCHAVHPEEPIAYQDSYHARVKCVECHMSRVGTLYNMYLKSGHMKHLFAVIFGRYEHPTEAETMRPTDESCELCHWPPAFHGDTVREIFHFQADQANTETRTYLILKTGGGERERGLGYGIHWHIENQVEFITRGHDSEEIPWVRATFPDGSVVEYTDVTAPPSEEELAEAEIQTMECVDCHNRIGHPFPSPDRLLDQAMAEGRLSTNLPYIKAELLALLTADYASQDEAMEYIDQFQARYQERHPEASAAYAAEVEQAVELARELVDRVVFEEADVSWESFPNHSGHGGHNESAGCFRCHDGTHIDDSGDSIRLHCNICHSIPMVVRGQDRVPQMPVVSVQEPDYHLDANFIADHRFQANSVCEPCHGPVDFGSDDSSFCSNSACHGRAWPEVDLNAAFPHPIELEGRHAEVWCHECHEGIERPVYACSNCHEPPTAPHFGETCEECHTPAGFDLADMTGFEHAIELEGAHAEAACSDCHTYGESLVYDCAECHEPPSETHFGQDCAGCHTPEGFEGATIPPEMHPIPLIGAHQRATCSVCHADGQRVPEYLCENCHQPPDDHYSDSGCDDCHTPEGWIVSAAAAMGEEIPEIPHPTEGREDCWMCHDPEGQIQPAPSDHAGRDLEECLLCHSVED